MATNQNRNQYRNLYRTNGAAAYDINAFRGTSAPEIQRPKLPEEQRRPVRRVRVKAKAAVSPFAVVGMMAAACMLVLVIFGYVQLYEATSEVGDLTSELSALQQENQMLQSEYEGKIDLAAIEERATKELGMDARFSHWQGVIAPRGLPKDVLRTLETAMSEVVNSEAFQQEALRLKTKAHWMSSEAFRKLYDEELNTYGEILKHSLPQK